MLVVPVTTAEGVAVKVPITGATGVDDAARVAVTLVLAFRGTAHGPVPEHPPPLHPINVDPEAGVAVKVTVVPAL